jgi:hypothetical protein
MAFQLARSTLDHAARQHHAAPWRLPVPMVERANKGQIIYI